MNLTEIRNLIFPGNIYCICCGNLIDDTRPYSLCDECMSKFRWANERTCNKCGKLLGEENLGELCYDCLNNRHEFDRGFTCVQYGLLEKKVIFALKYGKKTYIARILGEILHDRILIEDLKYDIVVPVPIHKKRLRKRGFNQAELLGKYFGRLQDKPCDSKCLIRLKQTDAQKDLSAIERRDNLREAIKVTSHGEETLRGKTVLIIDDIYTTGATADTTSMILREAGAIKIYFLSFAAGGDFSESR